jgi:hypothetical protein
LKQLKIDDAIIAGAGVWQSTSAVVQVRNHKGSCRARGAKGIPVDPTTWTEIIDAAGLLGLTQQEVEKLAGLG